VTVRKTRRIGIASRDFSATREAIVSRLLADELFFNIASGNPVVNIIDSISSPCVELESLQSRTQALLWWAFEIRPTIRHSIQ
jgi:hypothetical protein